MPQTPEDRIRAQYRGQKKRIDYRRDGQPTLWLRLARQWKRPVREIKRICGKQASP